MTGRASLILAVVLSALTTVGAVEIWSRMQRSGLTRVSKTEGGSHDQAQEHEHETNDDHEHDHALDHEHADESHDDHDHGHAAPAAGSATIGSVRLSAEARKNLGIVSRPLKLTTYWRHIEVPGTITDRPGISDRGVVAPVSGIVTQIYAYPGDTVRPSTKLFSLRLTGDSLHTSQLELFKASKEIEIAKQQKQRLEGLTQSGAVAGSRIIELDNQIERMAVHVQAYRQDLQARGLPLDRIERVSRGEFATEIDVFAPSEAVIQETAEIAPATALLPEVPPPFSFEHQRLKVELGQHVEAGEVLCYLADYRSLLIEGRGFKKDMPLIQNAARTGVAVDVEYELSEQTTWAAPPQQLPIHHLGNLIDSESRTFAFYLLLENACQSYERDGHARLIWRFRPGERVQLSVPMEPMEQVFVVPAEAVVREGPEAFVFRQNGELFEQLAAQVVHEDRNSIVLANGGKLRAGFFVAQSAAASLQRILKSQQSSGMPTNVHVHADGTVHEAH